MAGKFVFYNNYSSTLSASITNVATTASVVSAGDLATPPSGYTLRLTLSNPVDPLDVEIIDCSAVAGLAFTISREKEGTTAKAWAAGTKISARVTAEMLGSTAQGFDNGGNAKGASAVELQTGRDSASEVASGAKATTVGYGNTASGINAVAIGISNTASGDYSKATGQSSEARASYSLADGHAAKALNRSDLTAWAATTPYTSGNYYKIAASANYVLYCVDSGTSGGTEPVVSAEGYITDGTVLWYAAMTLSPSSSALAKGYGAVAIGQGAVANGQNAIAIGYGAKAVGNSAKAIGEAANAYGSSVTVFGKNAVTVGTGMYNFKRTGTNKTIAVGSGKYAAFQYAALYRGYEFVDQHDWFYTGSADKEETFTQSAREVTFYSIPVQLGDAAWPGASQLVKHGYSIRDGSYIYTAYCYNSDYFDSGTTGGTEPTWPTTPGDSVSDGDFDWICVDPASIQFVLPDYARFTPTSVGAIVKWGGTAGTSYAQLTFGVDGDMDKWLTATTFGTLTGNYASQFIASADLTNTEGAKQFGAAITTAGVGLDSVAVLVIKGYVVESEVA